MHKPISYGMIGGVLIGLGLGVIGYIIGGMYDYIVDTGIPNFAYAIGALLFILAVGRAYIQDIKQEQE